MNLDELFAFLTPFILIGFGIMAKYSVNDGWSSLKKWWLYFVIGGVFSLALTIFKYQSSKNKEKELYQALYESSKRLTDDESQRVAFANCVLESAKSKNGNTIDGLNLEHPDSLTLSIAADCGKAITKIKWTKEVDQRILMKVKSMDELKGARSDIKDKYAKCILSKLKTKYPQGIKGQVPQHEMDAIYMDCLGVMK